MRSVTTLLLLLLTFTFLSCARSNPKFGDEKKSECGEVPVGVTIDKVQVEVAGAQLGNFLLGNLNITVTPELQRVISEAATNALVQDYLDCKMLERAGVLKDPELVDYFTHTRHFLSTGPTPRKQTQWRQENPFPKKKGNPAQESADQDERMVYVECAHRPVPRTIPADDNLKGIMFFQRSPLLGEVRAPVFQPVGIPGDPNRWADNSGFGYVCQVINNGKIAVYHVLITFQLRFKKVIKQGPGSFSIGETTFSDDSWTGKIERLEVGPSGRFVFYMKNMTQDFLHVYMPKFVELRPFPEADQRKVLLSRQNDGPVHVSPWIWPPKDAF